MHKKESVFYKPLHLYLDIFEEQSFTLKIVVRSQKILGMDMNLGISFNDFTTRNPLWIERFPEPLNRL